VNSDPTHANSDELSAQLDRELGGVSQNELEMLAAARPASPRPDESGRVRGVIVGVRGDDVFVDIGAKSEALVALNEFEPDARPQPGQTLEFIMHGFDRDSGLMRLSLRQARVEADFDSLQVGDVLEGRVTGVNIGGLELNVKNLRVFMPKSQVALERVEDFSGFIGQRMECEVTEIDRRGRRLIASRRKLLEKEREQQREQLKFTLSEGQVRDGVVRRLTDFGAFVDIGGLEGLLHVSDLSYGRVKHPKDVLAEGDKVQVKVLKVDLVKDRVSLGLKQLEPDPWNVAIGNYRPGETVDGRVVKVMNFGAFVELEKGVEALLPVSEISWTQRIAHPKDVLKEGDSVRVKILEVDADNRKMSLSLKALADDPWASADERYTANAVVSGLVVRLADFGAFIQLEEGVEGLAHVSELSDKRIRTPGDAVQVGEVVKARIKSVDSKQRRISLSLKLATEATAADTTSEIPAGEALTPKKRKKALKGGLESGRGPQIKWGGTSG